MFYLILLLNEHRVLVAWTVALSLWVTAYVWYFHRIIATYFRRRGKHSWTVDMATKKATSHGKEELY